MHRTQALLGAMIALLLLSACSSSQPQSFKSIDTLAEAVTGTGVSCDRVDLGARAELVKESASCAGSEVTLYIFGSEKALADWQKVGTRLGPAVVGANWAATGSRVDLQRIEEELHGDLVDPMEPAS